MADTEEAMIQVSGSEYFHIDPEACALLVVDMQNSFVAPGAVFATPEARAIIPAIEQMVACARQLDIPVMWSQSDHSPPAGGLILDRYPIIRKKRELWAGDPSFELYNDMPQPMDGDHRIVKHKYDAFHGTDLDMVLRAMRKDTLIICGVATEICCESTARSAFFRDYKVLFLRDATASFEAAMQDATCDRIDALFGRAVTVDELVKILEEGAEV